MLKFSFKFLTLLTMLTLLMVFGTRSFLFAQEEILPSPNQEKLDQLVQHLTGTFTSEAGVGGGSERLQTTKLPDFRRALYVEISSALPASNDSATTTTVLYQAVWKFHEVNQEMRWQFWEITTPEKFVGLHNNAKLLEELSMYHLRELDCCELRIQDVAGTYSGKTIKEDCCVLGNNNTAGVLNVSVSAGDLSLETLLENAPRTARFLRE